MFRNKIVLVTGGAGFIGSHIVDKALELGAEKVIAFDNFVEGKLKNIAHLMENPRFNLICGNVQDYNVIKPYVEKSDFIFHEAASKLVASLKNPRIDLSTNIIGTFNILEAVRNSSNNPRIVHASTGSVLGSSEHPMDEQHATNPTTLYGISKLAGEKYTVFYAKEFGLKTTVLRYFHVFGPRQDYSSEAGVINIFLSRVLQGKPPVIFSGGDQIRCFTFVEDDVNANLLVAKHENSIGEIYNVASRTRMSIKALADMIINKYGPQGLKPVAGEKRQGENYKPIPDTSKIEKLGFKESISFEDGLDVTKNWIEGEMKNESIGINKSSGPRT